MAGKNPLPPRSPERTGRTGLSLPQAVAPARDPARLGATRQKLEASPMSLPLFDTERYARHLESAYEQMHARQRAVLPPEHLNIA